MATPALHDFRFIVRKATFTGSLVSYSANGVVYAEECHQMSYADAKAHLVKLSAAEGRSHSAMLTLKYREDRKPRGFANSSENRIDFESTSVAA